MPPEDEAPEERVYVEFVGTVAEPIFPAQACLSNPQPTPDAIVEES